MTWFEFVIKKLQLYIFDDTDPDETTYLGVAKIPLLTLAHDKPIRGTFELIQVFPNSLFRFFFVLFTDSFCNLTFIFL